MKTMGVWAELSQTMLAIGGANSAPRDFNHEGPKPAGKNTVFHEPKEAQT